MEYETQDKSSQQPGNREDRSGRFGRRVGRMLSRGAWLRAMPRGRLARGLIASGALVLTIAVLLVYSVGGKIQAAALSDGQVYSIAHLSPSLNHYLETYGTTVGVSIRDVTRHRSYGYNDETRFLMASSSKIPIMLEYFHYIETHGQKPSAHDKALLQTMIENSNNNAAQYFYDKFNDGTGLKKYLTSVGDPDYTPSTGGFGWGTFAPRDMVRLLGSFYWGDVTNASDRALGLYYMTHVESDQRMGVGTTAPNGAYVALKDGWVTGPDGKWAANSSGIVIVHGEMYIISVYTQKQSTLKGAYSILDKVCAQVEQVLVR